MNSLQPYTTFFSEKKTLISKIPDPVFLNLIRNIEKVNTTQQSKIKNHQKPINILTKKCLKSKLITSSESRLERLNNRSHRLVNGSHLSLSIKPGHDGIEPGGEPQVIHLFSSLTNGVLGVDSSTIHVSFLDRLLDFQFLRFLFLLALPCLPLQRF